MNNKGITLIALIITIILIIVIVGVTASSGIKSIDNFKIEAFVKTLELIQENVNIVSKKIKSGDVNLVNNNNVIVGTDITTIEDATLSGRITNTFNALSKTQSNSYRYFDKAELKKINIENIER